MRRILPLYFLALATAPSAQQPAFRATVEVVELDVSVTRGGQPVQGLTSRDFVVTDNGVMQEVDTVTLERLPLNVTLVLDVSQSLSGARLAQLVKAGNEVTRALRGNDRAALLTFSHAIRLRVSMTHDLDRVRSALGSLTSLGATALRDAVHVALSVRSEDRGRSLMLLFTDGRDTASWLTEANVLESVRHSGTVIHIIRSASDSFLNRLAEASGGRVWSATSDEDLRLLFTRALEEMRARYLLAYSPRGVSEPGWHDIRVRLEAGRADITARPGYFVADSGAR